MAGRGGGDSPSGFSKSQAPMGKWVTSGLALAGSAGKVTLLALLHSEWGLGKAARVTIASPTDGETVKGCLSAWACGSFCPDVEQFPHKQLE